MNELIQVGTTAMRDPATGEFLPAVPLYIKAEDREKTEAQVIDGDALMRTLAGKFKVYRAEEKKAKRTASCCNS